MKIDGLKVLLIGKLVRRNDGIWVARDRWGNERTILSPHSDPESWGVDGHPFGKQPGYGESHHDAWMQQLREWERAVAASDRYNQRIAELIHDQDSEPYWYGRDQSGRRCTFQGRIYAVDGDSIGGVDREEMSLLVKHFVVAQRQQFQATEPRDPSVRES